MSPLASSHSSNRRALLTFIAVLSAVVICAAAVVLLLQRQYLLDAEQDELHDEMLLLGELATDALLRSDYASVEGLIQRWVNSHPYITDIDAIMANGFVLSDVHTNIPNQQPLHTRLPITFNGRTLMTLSATIDSSAIHTAFSTIIIKTTSVAVAFILLLGWLLWNTLKLTALAPLEAQIAIREEKERELLQRSAELESALKELETFSYSVSHDLRSPLRAIDGFCQILLADHSTQLNPEARGHLERVVSAVQRMGGLIDDLLALSRLGRRELVKTDVNLSDMATQITRELQALAPERQVTFAIAPNLRAQGDAHLLHIILHNLLGNAWKYTSKKQAARIELSCIEQNNAPTLYCVRDNGAGFDMHYVSKLFQPFQRLHTADDFPGSGIGLATVARIIQRHGGEIRAEGCVGNGAVFCFSLTALPQRNPPTATNNQL